MPLELMPDIPPGMDDMNTSEISRIYMTIKKVCDDISRYINSKESPRYGGNTYAPTVIRTTIDVGDDLKSDVIIKGVRSDSTVVVAPASGYGKLCKDCGMYVDSYEFNKVIIAFTSKPEKAIDVNIIVM